MTENARQKEVTADDGLGAMEKETAITCPNDTDYCHISSEVPTIIKWILSVEESTIKETRENDEGAIVGVTAQIPKGIIKLQGNSRKSHAHSQMVSYGDKR